MRNLATNHCDGFHAASVTLRKSNTFADRLRVARAQSGLSQVKLGELSGHSQNAISGWERGDATPTAAALADLCRALGVSADYLIGLSPHESGLPAGQFIVDVELEENPKPGEAFAFQIPLRPRIATFAEVQAIYKRTT